MHISLLSNPVYNNKASDNFLDETRSYSADHSTSHNQQFPNAFHNIIQHNTYLQTLSTCYSDVILSNRIHHAQTKC
jgi:hypothetical protein